MFSPLLLLFASNFTSAVLKPSATSFSSSPSSSSQTFCPDGWNEYGNHCYYLRIQPSTWKAASEKCASIDGGNLLHLQPHSSFGELDDNNHGEITFIKKLIRNVTTSSSHSILNLTLWTGLRTDDSGQANWHFHANQSSRPAIVNPYDGTIGSVHFTAANRKNRNKNFPPRQCGFLTLTALDAIVGTFGDCDTVKQSFVCKTARAPYEGIVTKGDTRLVDETERFLEGQERERIAAQNPQCHEEYNHDIISGVALDAVHNRSKHECCDLCVQNTNCRGYAWNSYRMGTCYLKTADAPMVYQADVIAGYVKVRKGQFMDEDKLIERKFCPVILSNTDIEGTDRVYEVNGQNPTSCCRLCYNEPRCDAYAWNTYAQGTCYLKRNTDGRAYTRSNSGVQSAFLKRNSSSDLLAQANLTTNNSIWS